MRNTRIEASLPKSRLGVAFSVRLKRLRRGQEGASALEFAFVLPILLFLLTGMIDAGHIFFMQNNMLNATREAARNLAVGQITTEQEAEDRQQRGLRRDWHAGTGLRSDRRHRREYNHLSID